MLTFVEAISLAGDRKKQNDDACGFTDARAWVIDGATDLHDAPLTGAASDAAWFAHYANVYLHGPVSDDPIGEVTTAAAGAFHVLTRGRAHEPWQSPTASLLMLEERGGGFQFTNEFTIEVENEERPACIAEVVSLVYPA